jgi:hypothetical protein
MIDWNRPIMVRDPKGEPAVKWWDFERSRTGWAINWFILFPFFAAVMLLFVVMVVLAAIVHLPYVFYWPLHSNIRHGRVCGH